jgi:hypothetical protein
MPFSNSQEMGRPLRIKDEGITIATNASSIDLVGAGVAGSAVGDAVTETIPGGSGNFAYDETPSGVLNGSNVTFTLAQTPNPSSSLILSNNGQVLTGGGVDYILSGSTITMVNAPVDTDILRAKSYQY